jgi:hypothetical protein
MSTIAVGNSFAFLKAMTCKPLIPFMRWDKPSTTKAARGVVVTISAKDNVVVLKAVIIPDKKDNWENGRLGCDERFAKRADPINESKLNEALKNGKIVWEND